MHEYIRYTFLKSNTIFEQPLGTFDQDSFRYLIFNYWCNSYCIIDCYRFLFNYKADYCYKVEKQSHTFFYKAYSSKQ